MTDRACRHGFTECEECESFLGTELPKRPCLEPPPGVCVKDEWTKSSVSPKTQEGAILFTHEGPEAGKVHYFDGNKWTDVTLKPVMNGNDEIIGLIQDGFEHRIHPPLPRKQGNFLMASLAHGVLIRRGPVPEAPLQPQNGDVHREANGRAFRFSDGKWTEISITPVVDDLGRLVGLRQGPSEYKLDSPLQPWQGDRFLVNLREGTLLRREKPVQQIDLPAVAYLPPLFPTRFEPGPDAFEARLATKPAGLPLKEAVVYDVPITGAAWSGCRFYVREGVRVFGSKVLSVGGVDFSEAVIDMRGDQPRVVLSRCACRPGWGIWVDDKLVVGEANFFAWGAAGGSALLTFLKHSDGSVITTNELGVPCVRTRAPSRTAPPK